MGELKKTRKKIRNDASRTSEHEQDQFERTDKGLLAAHTRRQLQTEPSLAKVDGNLGGRISPTEGMTKASSMASSHEASYVAFPTAQTNLCKFRFQASLDSHLDILQVM
jgi:hypothetical protein